MGQSFFRSMTMLVVVSGVLLNGPAALTAAEFESLPVPDGVRHEVRQITIPAAPAVPAPIPRKMVYFNADAQFHLFGGGDSVYYTLYHKVFDPHAGCEVLVAKRYLNTFQYQTINDPYYWHLINDKTAARQDRWKVAKHSHDGCYYEIYRWDHNCWKLYGLFERELAR